MSSTTMLRDARIQMILVGIILVSAACWWVLFIAMPGQGMVICSSDRVAPPIRPWSLARGAGLLAAWAVMVPAMMLPGAAAAIAQSSWARRERSDVYEAALGFAAGYLAFVLVGAVGAALVAWIFESAGVMTGDAAIGNSALTGVILLAAGLCRLWAMRDEPQRSCNATGCAMGGRPSLREGFRHGRSCLGCCVTMICLQFAGGVMNLLWMSVLALWMIAEVTLPWKTHIAVLVAVALVTAGGLSLGDMIW